MNHLRNLRITVFGGTGFVGRHLIKYLCNHECIIKVPTRNPVKGYFLQPLGDVGQINLVKFDFIVCYLMSFHFLLFYFV